MLAKELAAVPSAVSTAVNTQVEALLAKELAALSSAVSTAVNSQVEAMLAKELADIKPIIKGVANKVGEAQDAEGRPTAASFCPRRAYAECIAGCRVAWTRTPGVGQRAAGGRGA
eukprot:727000-Pelagomonas_calceolata.AAC.2